MVTTKMFIPICQMDDLSYGYHGPFTDLWIFMGDLDDNLDLYGGFHKWGNHKMVGLQWKTVLTCRHLRKPPSLTIVVRICSNM